MVANKKFDFYYNSSHIQTANSTCYIHVYYTVVRMNSIRVFPLLYKHELSGRNEHKSAILFDRKTMYTRGTPEGWQKGRTYLI